jgi:hypothetical protein
MNLNSAFVCNANLESVLDTTAILHQFVDTVEVIMKPDISSAGIASNRLNEHAEGSTPDATCDLLMKIENGKVQNDQNHAITEIASSSDAFESEVQRPHSPASSNYVADESFSNASVFKLPNCEFAMGDHSTNCAGRAGSEPVLQASVKDTVNAPPMDAIIVTLVSAKETSESVSSNQITEVDTLDNHLQDFFTLILA